MTMILMIYSERVILSPHIYCLSGLQKKTNFTANMAVPLHIVLAKGDIVSELNI